jgi:hypoxia up-regulated 1
MMTIASENRLWSADSFVGAGRFPKTTFAETASFMGLDYDKKTIDKLALESFVLNDFVEDERGLFAFQTFSIENKDETTVYFVEEVVAMILKYGRTLSEN